MRQRILHPAPPLQHIRTQLDPIRGVKPPHHPLMRLAPPTADVGAVQLPAQLLDVVRQVADDGRVLQQVVALRLAARAVDGFVAPVCVRPVGGLARARHGARGHVVEVEEAREEGGGGLEGGGAAGAGVRWVGG